MVTVWLLVCFEEGVGDVAEELQSSNLGALRKGGSRGLGTWQNFGRFAYFTSDSRRAVNNRFFMSLQDEMMIS
jgi:hypothetical protein